MAIPQICEVWIEQRIDEELQDGKTNKSEIGRIIAEEIVQHFKVEVKPGTIAKRAERQEARTNVENPKDPDATPLKVKSNKSKRGGARKGAGRKKKPLTNEDVWKKIAYHLDKAAGLLDDAASQNITLEPPAKGMGIRTAMTALTYEIYPNVRQLVGKNDQT